MAFMNRREQTDARGYWLSFIINVVVGSLMLLLASVAIVLEILLPDLRGMLAIGFLTAAIVCLAIGIAHRRKYRSLVARSLVP